MKIKFDFFQVIAKSEHEDVEHHYSDVRHETQQFQIEEIPRSPTRRLHTKWIVVNN